MLALVPTKYRLSLRRARVHGLPGILTASDEVLAVNLGEMFLLDRGQIMVKGPGQNDRAESLDLIREFYYVFEINKAST